MKLDEIIVDPPANKLKKLTGIITPEVAASNYELISKLLAMKLTSIEMDEIQHMVGGDAIDQAGVDFYLRLMMKQLGTLDLEQLELKKTNDGTGVILATVFAKDLIFEPPEGIPGQPPGTRHYHERKFFNVKFFKGKWQVEILGSWNASKKRFDDPKKATDFATRFVKSEQKRRAEIQTMIDKAKDAVK
jgi:hypothetical protein